MAAAALLIVAGTTVAVPNSASARWGGGWHGGGWHGGGWHGGWRGGGWGWGGVGLGIGTGLLLAAAVSAPYYGGYGYDPYYYGYAPAYGYGPYGYGYRRAYWLWRLLPALSARRLLPLSSSLLSVWGLLSVSRVRLPLRTARRSLITERPP